MRTRNDRVYDVMSLEYRVYLHSYEGFSSTSVLLYGKREALLVDATQILSDAHLLAAQILPLNRQVNYIYISHFHPDHHFGAGVLQHAFPEAKVVALPSVVKDIVATSNDKMDLWAEAFGKDAPDRVTFPMPLHESHTELEGHEIYFFDDWEGDSPNNTIVWVPSLGLLLATDVAFNDAFVWTVESTVARRAKWRACLERLYDFEPKVVIPGHCSERTVGLRDTSCIAYTITYLERYEEALGKARSGLELWQIMKTHYPDTRVADFGLQWQARLLFPHSCPDWFAPLPGKPGEIFLDPTGKYDGDPPRE